MTLAAELQPDQQPARWDDHVDVYEGVFEPLTNAFARRALDLLRLRSGERLIDVAAGSGGTALMAADRNAEVFAADASRAMAARIQARAAKRACGAGGIHTAVMDGMALAFADASFDAAISVFGVILFPDAALGMREIARVLKPDGRVAVVTWTDKERYELAARLFSAIATVRGPQPPSASVPAQLRFCEADAFRALLESAGLPIESISRVEEVWRAPSARWLAEHIAFAPGLAATMSALGDARRAALDAFVAGLERDQGKGEVALAAVAQIAVARGPGGR